VPKSTLWFLRHVVSVFLLEDECSTTFIDALCLVTTGIVCFKMLEKDKINTIAFIYLSICNSAGDLKVLPLAYKLSFSLVGA
jgi:hypothetical protein